MARTKRTVKRKALPPHSSSSSSLSSSHKPKTRKRPRKSSTLGTSSSHPHSSVVREGRSQKKKMKQRKRLQIDLNTGANGDSSSSLTPNPFSSSSPVDNNGGGPIGGENAAQRERRRVAIQRQQPRRFPPNPSQADIDEWLQVNTENPWVKLSRKNIKRMRPTANIYLKQANFDPNNNRITRLLPGGVLARNNYPDYVMLTPINAPKRFSVQLVKNHLYIRKLEKDKITDEYEKEQLWKAVQKEDLPESPVI